MRFTWDKDLDSKVRDISVMYEISYSIGSSLSIKEEADNFLDKIMKRFGIEVGSIMLKDPLNSGYFTVIASKGFMDSQSIIGLKASYEYGINEVIGQNKAIIKNTLTPKDREWIIVEELQPRFGSYAFLPVYFGKEIIGILRLFSYRSNVFSDKLVRMLQSLTQRFGSAIHHIITIEDLTQTKKALYAEKEYLTVVLRSINEGVIVTDITGAVTLINYEGEKLTGWTSDEAVGLSLAQILNIKDDKYADFRYWIEQVIKTGKTLYVDKPVSLKSRDGTRRQTEISLAPLKDWLENIFGAVLIFRDITEKILIRTEIEELKAQRMESIGILAAGIAHDFNNILMAILGNISIAMNYTNPQDRIYQRLEKAKKAAETATKLSGQLLNFSKGGAPAFAITSIGSLISDVVSFTLSGTSIKSNITIPDDLWHVHIDSGQISQVIQNIVINAIQAMSEGGIIHIAAENMYFKDDSSILPDGKYVRISIKDNGCGISPEDIPKIFMPYYSTKKDKGSGLGLATAYSIIKKHRGHITVESEVGIGTTFYIFLPATEQQPIPPVEVTAKQPFIASSKKILLVDDEKLVRETAEEMLKHLGYKIEIADNSRDAIEVYKNAKDKGEGFEAVIIDLVIQGDVGGEAILKKLLEVDPEVTAIISSGYSHHDVIVNFRNYGFKGALVKPYKIKQLEEVITKALQKT